MSEATHYAVAHIGVLMLVCVGPTMLGALWRRLTRVNSNTYIGSRPPFFDNIRFFCEVQVVFSHYILFLDDIPVEKWGQGENLKWPRPSLDNPRAWTLPWPMAVYEMTMMWRITVFAFLSGLLSKGPLNEQRCDRLVMNCLVPILLYPGGGLVWPLLSGQGTISNPFFTDHNDAMWFMGAVVCWRLMINLFRPFGSKTIIFLGISISALAPSMFATGPYADDDTLSYKFALSYLFAFTLGFATELRTPQLERVNRWWVRILCCVVLLGLTAAFTKPAFVAFMDRHTSDLYSYNDEFTPALSDYLGAKPGVILKNPNAIRVQELYTGVSEVMPRLYRIAIAVITGTVAALTQPHSRTWFTEAGRQNAYAYTLHMLAIRPLHSLFRSVFSLGDDPVVWLAYLTVMPLALTFVCSTAPVRVLAWPIVEPTWVTLAFAGKDGRSTPLSWKRVCALPPADLGINTPRRFISWVVCEVVAVGAIVASIRLSPVEGPRCIATAGVVCIAGWSIVSVMRATFAPHQKTS